ncbi:PfkB family carbohydrate kinase [bacterium]|nr:PfkB family carbohydrate kinase [bacterium]
MKRILIIGESCLDVFTYGSADRLCPEAPVPVFKQKDSVTFMGMASNVHRNVLACLNDLGKEAEVDIKSNPSTGAKVRYIDSNSNQMFLRVDSDEYEEVNKLKLREANVWSYDVVIVSDYNKGYLTDRDLKYIADNAQLSFLDTKKKYNSAWANSFDLIKINEKEYKENGFEGMGMGNLIVTLGGKGCRFRGEKHPLKSVAQVRDVSGAGDTFLAASATNYLFNQDMHLAIDYAQTCCSIVVSKAGTATI